MAARRLPAPTPPLHLPWALWDLSRLAHASLKTVYSQVSHEASWRETLTMAQQDDWVEVTELFHPSVIRDSRASCRKGLRSKILYWLQRKS